MKQEWKWVPDYMADGEANRTLPVAVSFLEAYRRRDWRAMSDMSDVHDGALMAALLVCGAAVIPTGREVAGDELYLEVMDGLAVNEDGTRDDARACAIQMLNSRGGPDVGPRWAGAGLVQPTPELVALVNFVMAATLNIFIDMTATATDRDRDEAFAAFARLVTP